MKSLNIGPVGLLGLIALGVGLLTQPFASAGPRYVCGPNGCFLVSQPAPVYAAAEPKYEWQANKDNAGQVDLTQNGMAVGSYFFGTGHYCRWLGGDKWGRPQTPPIAPPAVPLVFYEGRPGIFFGAPKASERSQRKLNTVNGREITDMEVKDLLTGAGPLLDDDSKKKHLTAIAADAATKSTFEAFLAQGTLADVVADCRVQVYDASRPTDAAMLAPFNLAADPKFQATRGMLILQDPEKDGRGKAQIVWPKAEATASFRNKSPWAN